MSLIQIYQDTLDYAKELTQSVTTKHTFDEISGPYLDDKSCNIEVINSDSVSALVEYNKSGKTAVLNMASYKRPGGGVINGARAQEECLFRCSNLGQVISKNFYPLQDNELLWTNDSVFFKDVNYGYMKDTTVDVITIAAINLNQQSTNDYIGLTKNKIRLMLSMAIKNDIDNIILGAWGCGVFGNDPNKMSTMFKEVITDEGYSSFFKNIIFAIINDHNSVDNNYVVFKNIIKCH